MNHIKEDCGKIFSVAKTVCIIIFETVPLRPGVTF